MTKQLHTSDSLAFLSELSDYSNDIIYCDPPYALGSEVIIRKDGKVDYAKAADFMNKWEMPTGAYWEKWFIKAYRTLKHGGYLIMFGMDRQLLLFKYYAHLAGFEEQQSLYWYFISNFPKATDLSKMIDKNERGKKVISEVERLLKEGLTIDQIGKKCGIPSLESSFRDWKNGGHFPEEKSFERLLCGTELTEDDGLNVIERYNQSLGGGNSLSFREGKKRNWEVKKISPNSDLAKKYDGYKYSISPLKQTNETIMVFQKPCKTGSPLHDCLAYENGDKTITVSALNIDGNRVGTETIKNGNGVISKSIYDGGFDRNKETETEVEGRYPAQTFIDSSVAERLDLQSGVSKSTSQPRVNNNDGKDYTCYGNFGDAITGGYDDIGGCSKILHKCDYTEEDYDLYFYEPKVSSSERNAGCDEFDEKLNSKMFRAGNNESEEICEGFERFETRPARNNHPTLKPIALNERVLKLFKTPNPQRICYPFAGAGSEIIGGIKAGFDDWVGCEISQEYVDIANARIEYWKNTMSTQTTIFDFI